MTDPVLTSCPATVAQLQDRQLTAGRVGRERGDAHTLMIGDPQLRSGVRAFLAHDHPHSLGPACQVQQPGQLRHPGSFMDPVAIGVIGRSPRPRFIDTLQQVRSVRWEGEPDRVGQSLPVKPAHEVLRATSPIGADQDLLRAPLIPGKQPRGQLRESLTGDADVIGSGVRARVARTQLDRQRLTGPVAVMVDERAQRVVAETTFERRDGQLILAVDVDQLGIKVDDQRGLRTGPRGWGMLTLQGPGPLPRDLARLRDRCDHRRGVIGQGPERAGDRRG